MEYVELRDDMNLLVNRRIKNLFYRIIGIIIVFVSVAAVLIHEEVEHVLLYIIIGAIGMGGSILGALYRYFSNQHVIMEEAITQVRAYTEGNQNARIECDEEGDIYRLFHEVNALVAILNAHAQNETNAKLFLKNTLADISHQLKTPLAALNIYNGIIQEEDQEISTIHEFSRLSEQELDRIETLVQNLLKITKLDAGTILLEKTEMNLSEMMEEIYQQFAFRVNREKKTLHLSGDKTIMLWCDRTWFMEAISNIVKNALDHTQEGDGIYIEWTLRGSLIQVRIKDNGEGIHPEDLHHIFKRFYRSRFSKNTQGVGLGLSLAKAIIEQHSGTIEVESERGRGTSFMIHFLIPTTL